MTFERRDLFEELLERAAPRLAKTGPKKDPAQEDAERKAAEVVDTALKAQQPEESVRAFARRIDRDPKLIRDYAEGNRRVHLDFYFRLNKAGKVAFVRKLIAAIPEGDELDLEQGDDSEKSARCA